jgi:hypothetical protein
MKVWKPMTGAVLALALVASGCGGGGKKDDSTATVSAPAGNGSPESILNSISTNTATTGPQKIEVNVKLGVDGDPKDPSVAAFLSKPVTLTVQGTTDGTAKKTDLTFSVAAGPLTFNGAIRQIADQAWLQLNGKWYTLPANALSSSGSDSGTTTSSTSKIDAQQLIAAFGKPGSIIKNAKLDGTEDVGGVKSDHISGDVDIAALVKGLSSAMSSVGSSSTPVSPAQLQSSVDQLQQYVKGAKVDIYVGQSDHFVHKLATQIDGSIPSDQQAGSGISGFNLTFDVSSVGTDSPDVSPPDNPAPYEQLQSDIGGLLGGGLGGIPSSP